MLAVVCCIVCDGRCLFSVVCCCACVLVVGCSSLFVVCRCPLFVVRGLLFYVCYVLAVVGCVLFAG